MLEKLPPEILIYMQSVRKYITGNENTSKFFGVDVHGEKFFDKVLEIAQDNFEKTGEPQLSMEQFERVRIHMLFDYQVEGVFMYLGDLGFVSLN